MAKAPSTANWQTIDPATLPKEEQELYRLYKESYAEMKRLRGHFEMAMRGLSDAPKGKRLAFGYNFGKLSVALVDDDAKSTTAKSTTSLSDFLKSQGGRRV